MSTVAGPSKGKTMDLPIAEGGRPRFLVGLSWVPKEMGPKINYGIPPLKDAEGSYDTLYFFKLPYFLVRSCVLMVAAGLAPMLQRHGVGTGTGKDGKPRTPDPHDLDLFCYIVDSDLKVLETIGPKEGTLIETGHKVYHSGENQVGRDPKDAEQIFVEMKGLSPAYDQLFFVVKSANRNMMSDIPDATIRLADSADNANMLQNTVAAKALPPGNAFGYVFCSLFRKGDGWAVRNIDSFVGKEVDWHLLLQALELQQGLSS